MIKLAYRFIISSLFAFALLFTTNVVANDLGLFEEATELYQRRNFVKALKSYKSIEEKTARTY